MDSENIFIAHPTNLEQIEALKAIVKAFKIKYEVRNVDADLDFLNEIQNSLNQVKDMQSKKIPKEFAKKFLNEI